MMVGWLPTETARLSGPSRESRKKVLHRYHKEVKVMSIAERNQNAMAYIERCERRRQRKAHRRQRQFNRFMRTATPFAGGICVLAAVMALV